MRVSLWFHRLSVSQVLVSLAAKVYEPCGSLSAVRVRVEHLVAKFNEDHPNAQLKLILFNEAVLHLLRISRLLCQPRGCALLVGIHGSGTLCC